MAVGEGARFDIGDRWEVSARNRVVEIERILQVRVRSEGFVIVEAE